MAISSNGRKIWQSKGGTSLLAAMLNGTAEQEIANNSEAAQALQALKEGEPQPTRTQSPQLLTTENPDNAFNLLSEVSTDNRSKTQTVNGTNAAPDKTEAVSDSKPTKPATAQQQAETVANDDNPLNLSAERMAEIDAEIGKAFEELASLFGVKMNLTEEEEARLLPVMSKLFRLFAEKGYVQFKDAAKAVVKQIRKLAGDETADKLGIENLQGAYINLPKEIAGNKAEAMAFESIGQLMTADVPAAFWAETRIDTVDADSGTTTAAKAGALLDQVQRDARAYEQFMDCVRGL